MKPVTVDMLRAHLMAASLTAVGVEVMACVALLVFPVSQTYFTTTPFRLLAGALIAGGVIVIRQFARAAFQFAVQSRHATPHVWSTQCVSLSAYCPHRWLVVLHLRFIGRPFVVESH
ncbi:hypothetical protein B0G80_4608 [Paraburkholderia sp. BL6669N2]|uniref:hypothetical protein n=1 Tax=Paraburkholderia sp. BL6669N2 TaxID=1938807 RepID=UPI000E2589CF|nr:hypothetical protein [Paraburkholderia sp. BL6669N2]REG48403.1 hypothetical protein B0G80_4608 [Paraburkholderia sp. BL6669N2]